MNIGKLSFYLTAFFCYMNSATAENIGLTETYEKCMNASGGITFNMSECISAEAEFQDVRLNKSYKEVINQLPAERKKELQNVQRLWIQYRAAKCDFYEGMYEGGTIAPVMKMDCDMQMTATRAKELEGMIEEDQSVAPPNNQVNEQQANDIAGNMYRIALSRGINGMLDAENACWESAKKTVSETGIALCAIHGLTGTIIDATFARAQLRGSLPAYAPTAARERIFKNATNAGFTTENTQHIIDTLVSPHTQNVLTGLMNAGMR